MVSPGRTWLGQTTRVEVAGEDFIADILPIAVPQGSEGDVLAGAVLRQNKWFGSVHVVAHFSEALILFAMR